MMMMNGMGMMNCMKFKDESKLKNKLKEIASNHTYAVQTADGETGWDDYLDLGLVKQMAELGGGYVYVYSTFSDELRKYIA
jgi:hypothetical protein